MLPIHIGSFFMRLIFISLLISFYFNVNAQEKDSIVLLQDIVVKGYDQFRKEISTPASIGRLGKKELDRLGSISLVPIVNAISGVRMEERSPGSYRFSIRGSLLRSPFGVRNIKVYWDDLPLTDAGGNTYLNLVDMNGIGGIEILKGPGSSIFGAGTGGVVTLSEPQLNANDKSQYSFRAGYGSYGTFNAAIQAQGKTKKAQWLLLQSHINSKGYRENASLRRDVTQANLSWAISEKNQLKGLVVFSDLGYNTPGGLTQAQMLENPRMSRPAAGKLPSAIQQKVGVYNTTFLAGLSDSIQLGSNWSNLTSLGFSYTYFRNPFITNYEIRKEWNFSFRSSFQYRMKFKNNALLWTSGLEMQAGNYMIDSSGNIEGIPDMNVVRDKVHSNTGFLFSQMQLNFYKRWIVEWGLSINNFNNSIQRIAPLMENVRVDFEPKLMPRLSVLYKSQKDVSFFATISRGYSTPTLAEIKPSASGIYQSLQSEIGYNKEIGLKSIWFSNKLRWDLSLFRFDLRDAIVRRSNDAGQEYFVNAGGTIQKGLESNLMAIIYSSQSQSLKEIRFSNSLTLYDFRFKDYSIGSSDFSNNKLTGVPDKTVFSAMDIQFKNGVYGFLSMLYNSAIPLNDKNDVFASSYQLWQMKMGYKLYWRSGFFTDIYAVVDNMGNVNYSLGNDINAFGKRYFNPAPGRNYSIGFKITF